MKREDAESRLNASANDADKIAVSWRPISKADVDEVLGAAKSYRRGDADGNGSVNAKDARLALRVSAKLETLPAAAFSACDLDGNGKISATEARKILRYSAKLESSL